MYPEYEKQLMKIGDDIAYSRNVAKVHYPSDSEFGKKLGDEMYDFISKTKIEEVDVADLVDSKVAPLGDMLEMGENKNRYGIEVLEDNEYLYKGKKKKKKKLKESFLLNKPGYRGRTRKLLR